MEFKVEVDNKLEVDVEFAIISDACSITILAEKSSFCQKIYSSVCGWWELWMQRVS